MKKELHVAAAVICRDDQVFISLRDADKHQGGLWEFPGGKVEAEESSLEALKRELHEELGIDVKVAVPLIQVPYDYPDLSVRLHIFEVTEFEGEPWGKEGQPTQWVDRHTLGSYHFPAANVPIVNACLLPQRWMITENALDLDVTLQQVKTAAALGAQGVIVRGYDSESETFITNAKLICELANTLGLIATVNTSLTTATDAQLPSLHLNQARLEAFEDGSAFKGRYISASCHDLNSLKLAVAKGVDFVLLSPVLPTQSHPDQPVLGWQAFAELANSVPIPVYALGGLGRHDVFTAMNHGATGVAAISDWLVDV